MRAKRYQNSAALLIFMRRTIPVEPVEPTEPVEPIEPAEPDEPADPIEPAHLFRLQSMG